MGPGRIGLPGRGTECAEARRQLLGPVMELHAFQRGVEGKAPLAAVS